MHDLIKALIIFERYNPDFQTHCEHDVMSICGVLPYEVLEEDKNILSELGFYIGEGSGEEDFESCRWGSC